MRADGFMRELITKRVGQEECVYKYVHKSVRGAQKVDFCMRSGEEEIFNAPAYDLEQFESALESGSDFTHGRAR
jgi:hypothetical protein